MFDLMHDVAAQAIVDDRLRGASRSRLGRAARVARTDSHRAQVERVRASLLLAPRTREEANDA